MGSREATQCVPGQSKRGRPRLTKSGSLLAKITTHYLKSRDFNGIVITDLGEDHQEVRAVLRELLVAGKITLTFGDRHPNPHILAFEPESQSEQIEKLNRLVFAAPQYEEYGPVRIQTNSLGCCAYPSKMLWAFALATPPMRAI